MLPAPDSWAGVTFPLALGSGQPWHSFIVLFSWDILSGATASHILGLWKPKRGPFLPQIRKHPQNQFLGWVSKGVLSPLPRGHTPAGQLPWLQSLTWPRFQCRQPPRTSEGSGCTRTNPVTVSRATRWVRLHSLSSLLSQSPRVLPVTSLWPSRGSSAQSLGARN